MDPPLNFSPVRGIGEISYDLRALLEEHRSESKNQRSEPLQLMDTCRRVIRKQLGRTNLHLINHLPLPNSLRNYLVYQ
ncbi:unnamed protein product [Adineta steineri]|uniref:SOCS box domain-containing protein n=1 Tax=Adineta steineri TaxID=433720 RepID=A0A820LMY7_9BILA|nr:unnamed protein product [Adineta steineri]